MERYTEIMLLIALTLVVILLFIIDSVLIGLVL